MFIIKVSQTDLIHGYVPRGPDDGRWGRRGANSDDHPK